MNKTQSEEVSFVFYYKNDKLIVKLKLNEITLLNTN